MHQRAYALGRDEGERLQFGETIILLRAADDGATVWEEIAPLLDTPLHVHANEDEFFHIIDGEHEFRCGEQEFRVGPGAFVYLPRGIPHAHRRMIERAGRLLVITAPGGFDGFFRMLMAADQAGEFGPSAYARASARFGITWPTSGGHDATATSSSPTSPHSPATWGASPRLPQRTSERGQVSVSGDAG